MAILYLNKMARVFLNYSTRAQD